jgi:hypothetical protein
MRRHHMRMMFWLLVSAGWHTACQGHPIDIFPPQLIFLGAVRNPAGSGVRATVEIQRRVDCDSSTIIATHSVEIGDDGSYELREAMADRLVCFVVFALSTDVPLLQSDTIRIPGSELDELGDPFGTGRIPLDITEASRRDRSRYPLGSPLPRTTRRFARCAAPLTAEETEALFEHNVRRSDELRHYDFSGSLLHFVPNRLHRIDAGRSSGGDVAGQERHYRERYGHRPKGHPVHRIHSV